MRIKIPQLILGLFVFLALIPAVSSAAPVIAQQKGQNNGGNYVTGFTVTLDAPSTAGNTLVMSLVEYAAAASDPFTSITDDGGNTWVRDIYVDGDRRLAIYRASSVVAGTSVITVNSLYSKYTANLYEISGLDASPLDQATSTYKAYSSNSSFTSPSVTTTADSEIFIGVNISQATGYTAGDGWTTDFTYSLRHHDSKIVSTAGSYNYTASWTSAYSIVAEAFVTYKAAVVAGAPTAVFKAPASGATISGSAVALSASSTDNIGVAGVSFYHGTTLIGSEITEASGADTYSTTFDSTAVADGSYSLTAVARDASNNYATSTAVTVTVDNTGPVISSITSGTPATTIATTTWTTNESANSQVAYGLTNAYGATTTLDATMVTSHSVVLTGLTAGTVYHYRVVSTDASGNTTYSTDNTFTTAEPGAPEIAVSDDGTDIASGGGPIDFRYSVRTKSQTTKTFTVSNTGTDNLTTSDLAVPTGYTVTEALSATIAPGGSDTFTVRLDNTELGTKTGNIIFSSNDGDEASYSFSVTGDVIDPFLVTMRYGDGTTTNTTDVGGIMIDRGVSSIPSTDAVLHGTSTTITVRDSGDREMLMHWDLDSQIPRGTKINKAVMRIFTTSAVSEPTATSTLWKVWKITDPSGTGMWDENNANYSLKNTGIPWQTSGDTTVDGVQADSGETTYDQTWTPVGDKPNLYVFDVTDLVQEWVDNPDTNLGLALKIATLSTNTIFASRENSDSAKRPYIEVSYYGEATTSPTQATGLAATYHSGQTFIHWTEPLFPGKTEVEYKVYRSESPITAGNIGSATLLGSLWAGEGAYYSKSTFTPLVWNLIPTTPAGFTLGAGENMFVYSVPATSTTAHYAVTTVVNGFENITDFSGANSLASPVEEAPGQFDVFPIGTSSSYNNYIMFMGGYNPNDPTDLYGFNSYTRSVPRIFSYVRPLTYSASREPYPLTLYLAAVDRNMNPSEEGIDNARYQDANNYGGFGMSFYEFRRMAIRDQTTGEAVTFSESEIPGLYNKQTFYSGWPNKTWNWKLSSLTTPVRSSVPERFEDGVVVDYNEKSIIYLMDWLTNRSDYAGKIDSSRYYISGGSQGAIGGMRMAYHNPGMFAGLSFNLAATASYFDGDYLLYSRDTYGTVEMDLKNPDGDSYYDWIDIGWLIENNPSPHYPYTMIYEQINDELIPYDSVYNTVAKFKEFGIPLIMYRGTGSHGGGDTFVPTERINERYYYKYVTPITNYEGFNYFRLKTSRPWVAFGDFALDDDISLATTAGGGINRYPWFDEGTVSETANTFRATLKLLSQAPSETSTVTVIPQNTSLLNLTPGTEYAYSNVRVSDSATLQSGTATVGASGLLKVTNITIGKDESLFTLGVPVVDTTAPAVTMTSPASGATVTGSAVDLVVTATDDVAVAGVTFYQGDMVIGSEVTISSAPDTYTVAWDTTSLVNGSYTLKAVVRDTSNNYATSSGRNVTVANTGPVVTSISAGTPTNSGATITWVSNPAADSQVEYGLTSDYIASTTLVLDLVTSHSVALSDLATCTNYHYRVISRDSALATTSSSDKILSTAGCTGDAGVSTSDDNTITTELGGSLSLDALSLIVPTTFSNSASSANFQVKKLDSTAFFASAGNPSGKSRVGTNIFNLKALTNLTTTLSAFSSPLTVSLTYTASEVVGIDTPTLKIYRYDGSIWTALTGCVVSTSLRKVTCQTSAFSDFAIFGDPLAGTSAVVAVDYRSSGTSVIGQVQNLITIGNIQAANELKKKWPNLFPVVKKIPTPRSTEKGKISFLSRSWSFGQKGNEVKQLQQFLNTHGYIVSKTGPGSLGQETTVFGHATKAAVIKFQKANKIDPIGIVGPATRKAIEAGG